ncbi:MAG: YkgJ family cysteine cluster protein [Candidatus Sericytochromatia bacterium]|nr:YkgJ family cysteine cluster protein [Candidatus Sericytochromatia bacterium]
MEPVVEGLASNISQAYHALKEVNCVEDVYDVIDFISDETRNSYKHIVCKVGCSDCCKGLHPPYITAAEWEYILYYLNDLPKVVQDEIIRRARWYAQEYRDALLLQQDLIDGKMQSQQEIDQAYKTLSKAMADATCPFLVIDRCGIYPVRPAKCRAHGNYLVKVNEKVRVHTCLPQVSEWESYIDNQEGNRGITLPLWNVYEQVIGILNPPNTLVASMPIWLITHIKGNTISTELDSNPYIAI